MTEKQRVLVVEDNPEFIAGARNYFAKKSNIECLYAQDYREAVTSLCGRKGAGISGALIDCFFPEITGSGNISLGKEIIARIEFRDHQQMNVREGLNFLGQYVDLNDPEIRKYAQFISSQGDISKNPIAQAIKTVGILGKEATGHIVKNVMQLVYDEKTAPKDYYRALEEAIEKSEANQPLGISVARTAQDLGIPFVFVTSTYHHDLLTQPIQNYISLFGWQMIDCSPGRENEKSSPEFWERAFGELERKLK